MASARASHTGRAVARGTSLARDAEAGVVVDARHQLELGAVREIHPAHDVHLPELHGPGAFPATIVGPLAPAGLVGDEAVPDQAAVDGGAGGDRRETLLGELIAQGEGTPVRVLGAQRDEAGLDLGGIWCGQVAGRVE